MEIEQKESREETLKGFGVYHVDGAEYNVDEDVFFKEIFKLEAEIKALREARMIDLAIAQFTGYINADRGHRLADLVGSMGLTANEWRAVKKQGLSFRESEVEEIDQLLTKNEG